LAGWSALIATTGKPSFVNSSSILRSSPSCVSQ
jgi:hypothetical protein